VKTEGDRSGTNTAAAVRAYYDSNTTLFLWMGIGRRTLAIRRAVWARGVRNLEEAVNYVNGLIASEAQVVAAAPKKDILRILDIGCGVGGSLLFLASVLKTGFRGVGITISPRQSRIASRQAAIRGLSDQCSFLAGDFTLVSGLRPFHLSFAIESFVHFASPAAFFAPAAGCLEPGGRLIVADDFLSRNMFSRPEARMVEAFRHGWILPSLGTVEHAVHVAGAFGLQLVEDRELSAFLSQLPVGARMGRWAVRIMRAIPGSWPYWQSSVGSLAQAACRRAGLVEYHFLVFEKKRTGSGPAKRPRPEDQPDDRRGDSAEDVVQRVLGEPPNEE
jgi:cyclopropane fatty-acyl-phospholipid synthase-like methyltransferase